MAAPLNNNPGRKRSIMESAARAVVGRQVVAGSIGRIERLSECWRCDARRQDCSNEGKFRLVDHDLSPVTTADCVTANTARDGIACPTPFCCEQAGAFLRGSN